MKRSMGWSEGTGEGERERGGEGETEDGRAGAVMGWKDQCVRACASVMGTIFGADGAGAVVRGSGAPR